MLNQRVLQGRKPPVGRVDEDEIVAGAGAGIGAQGCERILAEDGCALEGDSSPIAPEPAKRSSTAAPSGTSGPSRLKAASRTRSPVGLVSSPFGAKIRAPLREPAMILTRESLGPKCHVRGQAPALSASDRSNGKTSCCQRYLAR